MGLFDNQDKEEKLNNARYESIDELDEDTQERVKTHLAEGEEFILGFETNDSLIGEARGDPVIVTDRRVIDITKSDSLWMTFGLASINGILVRKGGRKIMFLGLGSDENTDVSVDFSRTLSTLGDEFARTIEKQKYSD